VIVEGFGFTLKSDQEISVLKLVKTYG